MEHYLKSAMKMLIIGLASLFLLCFLARNGSVTPDNVVYIMSLFWIAVGAGEAYVSHP